VVSKEKRNKTMSCSRALTAIYWFVWVLGGAWMKLLERIFLSLVYRYFLTLLQHSWAEVVAGVGIGVLLSSFFWVVKSVGDPSSVCVVYVATFSYVSGSVIVGFFVVASFFVPHKFIDHFPASAHWSLQPRTLGIGAYAGVFCGLALSFAAIIAHPEPLQADWCELGGMSPASWGLLMFFIGMLSNSAYLPPLEAFGMYSEAEEERRRLVRSSSRDHDGKKKSDDEFQIDDDGGTLHNHDVVA